MKTILIACGTGMVSSAIINNATRELLRRHHIPARIITCGYNQMERYLPEAALVIAPMAMEHRSGCPVLLGTPFLTGVGVEELEHDILCRLAETPMQPAAGIH